MGAALYKGTTIQVKYVLMPEKTEDITYSNSNSLLTCLCDGQLNRSNHLMLDHVEHRR